MKFTELVAAVKDNPVFETGFLLVGDVNPDYLRKQFSLWVKSKKLIKLKRGLYTLAPPYQKIKPHPFLLANHLQPASYISLQSALLYYNLIPEHVPITTSVTTGKPGSRQTPLGVFEYRHIKMSWFNNYYFIDLGGKQHAFIAKPEKAILDLIILEPKSDSMEYLRELRLQNLDSLDLGEMERIVASSAKPKLTRSFKLITQLVMDEKKGYQPL